jgi:hypothetical protein
MADPDLTGVTHLVLDEVHERGCESDLLLLLLRRLLARRAAAAGGGGAGPPPKLLLMSATADAELFAGYFRKVGGRASGRKDGLQTVPGGGTGCWAKDGAVSRGRGKRPTRSQCCRI